MRLSVNDLYTYGPAFGLALLLHAGVVVVMTVSWGDAEIDRVDIHPYYIEASIVAENPYTALKEREARAEQSKRQQRIEQRRLTEEQLRAEQAAWEKEQAEKRRRQAEAAQAQPVPEPVAKASEPEAGVEPVDPGFAEEIAALLAREANARKAVTDDEKAMAYVAQIQREIIQNWSRPPSARNGMQALLRVHLIPTGEVVDVELEESSGNDAFDRSAILAVRKAERFVVPRDSRQFERNFREFTVLFRPDDLRL